MPRQTADMSITRDCASSAVLGESDVMAGIGPVRVANRQNHGHACPSLKGQRRSAAGSVDGPVELEELFFCGAHHGKFPLDFNY